MQEPILTIDVTLDESFSVTGAKQTVNMITFHGSAQSDLFDGVILPGGVDTQHHPKGGAGRLSARYMLDGKDLCGEPCRIYVDNTAHTCDGPMTTHPVLTTNSRALAYLESADLEGSLVGTEKGVCITVTEKTEPVTREEITIELENKTIYGELYLPQSGAGKLPLVIASHGYGSCCAHMRSDMELLASYGIACFAYDFCGGGKHSRSSGSTLEMRILTEQRDLLDVFAYASTLDFVDRERIYLYGSSQGGLVSALAAAQLQDKIAGIFLQFPAFCIPDDWAAEKGKAEPLVYDFMGMQIGRRYADDLPDEDIFTLAAAYKGPAVLFHGDADSLVRLHYSERLAKEYEHAELFVYPGQGHGFASPFTRAMLGTVAQRILSK